MPFTVERKKLLESLDIIEPAISEGGVIPILGTIWFTGKDLMAFNDNIAISIPFKSTFKGAVAPTLIELLRNSGAEMVQFDDLSGSSLKIKVGKASFNLPAMPPNSFIFKMPEENEEYVCDQASVKDFIEGIEACLRSVGSDPSHPDQLGVTVIPMKSEKELHLFATNDITLSHAVVKVRKLASKRFILSTEFCKQLVKLPKDDPVTICVRYNEYSLAYNDKIELYGRLVNSENPLNFAEIIKRGYPEYSSSKKLPKIPKGLEMVLERAVIITNSKLQPSRTAISIQNGKINLVSESDRGIVKDQLFATDQQPNLDIKIDLVHLKKGLKFDYDNECLLFTKRCAVIKDRNILYMVGATAG